jgi:N-glycosylase/DNA lyase
MNPFPPSIKNLELTLFSGQTFSWFKDENDYIGATRDRIIKIKKVEEDYFWQTYPENNDFEFINNYFLLDLDYEKILEEISHCNYVLEAIAKYEGLRILNQDFQQTLFSFLLAQNKNIKAIRRSLDLMKQDFGKEVEVDGKKYYLFPDLEFFKSRTEKELMKYGVGYRAKYLKDTAEKFDELKINIPSQPPLNLRGGGMSLSNDGGDIENRIRSQLLEIHGIGNKVADCVMAFSLGFHSITPIDVWGDRILKQFYKNTRSKNYDQKRKYFTKKFGNNTAWAGQFLFEYVRQFEVGDYFE